MSDEAALYPVAEVKGLYHKAALYSLALERISEQDDLIAGLSAQVDAYRQTLEAVGAVLHTAGRAMRMEASAHDAVTVAMDCTPMRNLMSTAYGLTALGGDKPARKTRGKP